jgi:hypothetical protein
MWLSLMWKNTRAISLWVLPSLLLPSRIFFSGITQRPVLQEKGPPPAPAAGQALARVILIVVKLHRVLARVQA